MGEKGNKKTPHMGRCNIWNDDSPKNKPADNFSRNESSGTQWPGEDWLSWTRIACGGSATWNDPWLQFPVWLKKLFMQSRVISVHSWYLTSLITSLSTDFWRWLLLCWIAPLASLSTTHHITNSSWNYIWTGDLCGVPYVFEFYLYIGITSL